MPLGAIVIALGLRVIPAGARHTGPRNFDATGAVLVTAGLVALTYGIVRTDTLGWGAPGVLVPLAAAVALLAAFAVFEGRFATAPLVPLSIFRLRRLRAANAVVVLLYAAQFPSWFFLTLYTQQVLHYDAIEAGLGFLPITLTIFATSTRAPRLVERFGPQSLMAAGMLFTALGMLLLTGIAPGGSYVTSVLPGGVISAFGMGLTLVPSTIVATQGVRREQSGLASGLLNTSRLDRRRARARRAQHDRVLGGRGVAHRRRVGGGGHRRLRHGVHDRRGVRSHWVRDRGAHVPAPGRCVAANSTNARAAGERRRRARHHRTTDSRSGGASGLKEIRAPGRSRNERGRIAIPMPCATSDRESARSLASSAIRGVTRARSSASSTT